MNKTPMRSRPLVIPTTPPTMYSQFSSPPACSSSSNSSSHCFSPMTPVSPTFTMKQEREIIMGGLVSRSPRSEDQDGEFFSEKSRQGSIEVPGIILTEPIPESPPRSPSPPPKSILLLPPASLPIPTEGTRTLVSRSISLPSFFGKSGNKTATTVRSLLLLGAIVLGGWHLYTTLDISTLTEDGQF